MSIVNPSIGTVLFNSSALLISIAFFVTIKYISKLKIRYTKIGDWIKIFTLLYEKALKESMIDEKLDLKEYEEIKKIYNHYLD